MRRGGTSNHRRKSRSGAQLRPWGCPDPPLQLDTRKCQPRQSPRHKLKSANCQVSNLNLLRRASTRPYAFFSCLFPLKPRCIAHSDDCFRKPVKAVLQDCIQKKKGRERKGT
mmetsp:Transcript_28375/g.45977  ORF Transcript_28375/g.45977 Transcript_28375/m.45977 type:complete len:112 (+) Transcript_28375:722-1057(+)